MCVNNMCVCECVRACVCELAYVGEGYLCECMYIYMHACIHTYTHCMHAYIHACTIAHKRTHTHTHTRILLKINIGLTVNQNWPCNGPVLGYGTGSVLAQYQTSTGLRYWPSTAPLCTPELGHYWASAGHLPESGQYWPNMGQLVEYSTGPVLGRLWLMVLVQYWPSIGPVVDYDTGPVLVQYWASTGLRYWPSAAPLCTP